MKSIYKILTIIFVLISFTGYSQTKANGKVLITGSRFTYPLVEKWITEFKKSYPEVEIRILARRSTSADSGNLIINGHKLEPSEIKPGYEVININRYVLLPVTNINNPSNKELQQKGLSVDDVKKLFFENENYFEETSGKGKKKGKPGFSPTVYTREEQACAPTAFAQHYGFQQANIKGTGVSGDDKYLIHAVKKDSSGITYNNAGYIYDLISREPISGISVIPYDLNENDKVEENENFYASLDDLVHKLETTESKAIPIEHVNISYPKVLTQENQNLKLFLDYVLSEGQKYNHEFGFLNLETDHLAKQKAVLNRN